MKSISIRQPWAWAIIHGGKDIENRTWHTNYTGTILIHAGKKFDHDGYKWLVDNRVIVQYDIPTPDQYQMGGIIGISNITGCVSRSQNPWFFGPYGFKMADSSPVKFVPLRGRLGLFNVPDELVMEVSNA